ncbi:hypothetical protein tinsulaeT_18110 [Thalassotalea insulae]|uniref:Uncharacterized protein n=1 Tax=Thalassotalea insulae TaxID=2056778 RepID=A0ABQ6GWD6_9GAMM|nr:hypothetical protein [Thalassotalea insulae]GLX78471.1 hypothetical protein tinsulaeT_18110 [Thalassotalea insulae]
MKGEYQLIIAAMLSFIASLLHVMIIFGGASWYRFFGAGERMAKLAESGSYYPMIITLAIALMLFLWGLYALSAAGVIVRFPLIKWVLCAITAVYLLRGVIGLIAPFISRHPAIMENSVTFWLSSSIICCLFGVFYLLGTIYYWRQLASVTS